MLGILLFASTGARAGILLEATWFQVTQGIPLTRTHAQLGAGGGSVGSSIAVTLSYPFVATTRFVPKTPNAVVDLAIQVTQGGPQLITATAINTMTAGMVEATPGVPGTVVVMTAVHQNMGVDASMFMVGATTLIVVPLNAGKADQFTGTFFVTGNPHTITVDFYAWTPGSFLFTGLTSKGNPLPNVGAAGSFFLSAFNTSLVSLVSPSKVSIDGALAQRRTASFSKLTLRFAPDPVPEPAALLLLGAGVLALAFSVRHRFD